MLQSGGFLELNFVLSLCRQSSFAPPSPQRTSIRIAYCTATKQGTVNEIEIKPLKKPPQSHRSGKLSLHRVRTHRNPCGIEFLKKFPARRNRSGSPHGDEWRNGDIDTARRSCEEGGKKWDKACHLWCFPHRLAARARSGDLFPYFPGECLPARTRPSCILTVTTDRA